MAAHTLDLTHPFTEGMFTWPGDPPFEKSPVQQSSEYFLNKLSFSEHGGTHIGMAAHFNFGSADVASLLPEQLITVGVCINLTTICRKSPNHLMQINDITRWEKSFGKLPEKVLVLIATGWDKFWDDPDQYFGKPDYPHFPGIAVETMQWLVQMRKIVGVGIDTAGIDGSRGLDLSANRILLRENRFHLENLTNLAKLPPHGFTVYIGALLIPGATGSPCRVLAHWED